VFLVLAPRTFLDSRIYSSFAQTTPYFAIIALPLTMVIIAGDMDLSFPSIMALGMVGFVGIWHATGSVELGIVAALLVGVLAGLFNGLVISHIGIPSIVVTIGTLFLFRGLALVLVGGRSFALVKAQPAVSYELLVGKLFGIPMEFFWLVVFAVGTWLLLNRHRLGQNAYVTGDNRLAAGLMGIPIRRTRIILFVLTWLCGRLRRADEQPQIVNFLPDERRRIPASGPGGVRRWQSVLAAAERLGTFTGGVDRRDQAGIVAVGLTDYYTGLIYGAVILISVSIHALLRRRFEY
jgi:simple sugar transport system permease protein